MIEALRAAGITPKHLNLGTQRLPCPRCVEVKFRRLDTALALTVEPDGHAVWLCHRCGFKGNTKGFARVARRAVVIRLADARLGIERERHANAAARARAIWHDAAPASAEHPYLRKKRLPGTGLRQAARFQSLTNALLVPMRDATGAIINLQGIDAEGTKRFLAGAQTRRAFCTIGEWRRGIVPVHVALGEGYASTAAFCSLYRAFLGVAALSAGNMPAVARVLREKFPAAEIVIVADADPAGMRAAGEAAALVGAEIRVPGFAQRGGDWSDFLMETHAG